MEQPSRTLRRMRMERRTTKSLEMHHRRARMKILMKRKVVVLKTLMTSTIQMISQYEVHFDEEQMESKVMTICKLLILKYGGRDLPLLIF